jgi:fimbrial chaperone protein
MLNFLNKSKIIILLIACILPSMALANYTITPVKVQIKPNSMMTSLTVHNNNDASRHFQVRVYRILDIKTGKMSEEETKDLVASPSMFKVADKKAQMVRLAVKKPEEAFKHKHYVVSVKELTHGAVEANTVKIVTDFRIPVLVGAEDGEEVAVMKK